MNKKIAFGLLAVLITCIFTVGTSAAYEQSTILTAEKTTETITMDGHANEASWAGARDLVIVVRDGSIGTVEVELRALYDDSYIYIYTTWPDPTENTIRDTWVYDADNGSWHRWNDTNETAENEDRIMFAWNIDDSIHGFNVAGCAMTCHGDRHHTTEEYEKADAWHWKATRTGPAGYIDDKYWDNGLKEGTDEEALEAGRHGDEKDGGGYRDNKQVILVDGSNVTIPKYYEPDPMDEIDARFLFQREIDAGEAAEVTQETAVENGTTVPGYILERPEGSRGDIASKGAWLDGRWHVELKRKLDTGHEDDVQFDTTKLYRFGVAVSDNAGGFEAYGEGHSFDLMARTLEFGGIGSEEITQLVLVRDYLTSARAYASRGEPGMAFSEISYALTLYNEIGDAVARICPQHYSIIKKGFGDAKREPSVDNIDELIKDVDETVLVAQGKMDPHEATWHLKVIVIWGKVQLYVFVLLGLFALYPFFKTIQVGMGPELRRMSVFLTIAIAPMFLEGVGRIGIYTRIHFLQNFSFMTNEYASLLWAMWMFIALLFARSGYREVTGTIQSLKTLSTKLEEKVRERTIKLERSNALKDLFTDIMRHDLLGPIGAIENSTELMLDGEKDTEKRELIRIANESADRLIELIEDASKYAAYEELEGVDLQLFVIDKMLKETAETLEPSAIEKNITIEHNTCPDCVVKASPLIKEVFWNLLSNAIKYSPENSKIVLDVQKGPPCTIAVIDNGPGIPDEEKERIFERFARIKKGGVRGSGLGLAIVKRIVDLHNGKVWVEDNPEGGSIFKVVLPT